MKKINEIFMQVHFKFIPMSLKRNGDADEHVISASRSARAPSAPALLPLSASPALSVGAAATLQAVPPHVAGKLEINLNKNFQN